MFEDIDFSTRVHQRFGDILFINPNARLEHLSSPANRDSEGIRQKRKITEYIVFYKKRRGGVFVWLSFYWLLFGMFLESISRSIKIRSVAPLFGFVIGLRQGMVKKVFFLDDNGKC
jgi:GT2 family glycosyltransferase